MPTTAIPFDIHLFPPLMRLVPRGANRKTEELFEDFIPGYRTLVPARLNPVGYCMGKRLSIRSWTFSWPTIIAASEMALSRSAAFVM